jgi:hypothetical protein
MPKNKVVTKFQKIKRGDRTVHPSYKHPMMKPQPVPEKIQYLIDNEKSGKGTVELVREFQEQCGHSLKEVAFLKVDDIRHTYQVCSICGALVTGKKKASG